MKGITRTFIVGLVTLLPLVGTVYLLGWLFSFAESGFGGVLRWLLPESYYLPGMGIVTAIILIFVTGMLMHAWAVRKIFTVGERIFTRIPLVKSIYGAIRDFMQFLSQPRSQQGGQVVSIRLPGAVDMRMVGVIMRSDTRGLPRGLAEEGKIVVYIPFSYQIGGHTVILPRSAVEPVDMTVEEAMKFSLTAGVASNGEPPIR